VIEVLTTGIFDEWFEALRDRQAKVRIQTRIDRIEMGNFGDHKFFMGIGELRIDYGPGYRIYFARHGGHVVILLSGGEKHRQAHDIKRALEIAKEINHIH
jgi:putative addiction module killer protein